MSCVTSVAKATTWMGQPGVTAVRLHVCSLPYLFGKLGLETHPWESKLQGVVTVHGATPPGHTVALVQFVSRRNVVVLVVVVVEVNGGLGQSFHPVNCWALSDDQVMLPMKMAPSRPDASFPEYAVPLKTSLSMSHSVAKASTWMAQVVCTALRVQLWPQP